MVTGEAWGFASTRGEFFTLGEVLLEHGTGAEFRKLLADEKPVVRAMGIYCLARKKGQAALPDLRTRLGDSGAFEFVPAGCTIERATVGTLAFSLVLDRNYLHLQAKREPLLSGAALTELCLEVLLRDECVDIRRYQGAGRSETWRTFTGLAGKGRAALVKTLPTRSLAEIAKAVGRLPPDEASRSLLAGIVTDTGAGRAARLAAASGLTRDPSPAARLILSQQEVSLNGKDPAKPGTRFVGEARRLRAKTGSRKDLHPIHLEKIASRLNLFMGAKGEKARKQAIADLKALADALGLYVQPWDTWTDAPYRFRGLLDQYRDARIEGAFDPPLITAAEEKDLRRRLSPYLK